MLQIKQIYFKPQKRDKQMFRLLKHTICAAVNIKFHYNK